MRRQVLVPFLLWRCLVQIAITLVLLLLAAPTSAAVLLSLRRQWHLEDRLTTPLEFRRPNDRFGRAVAIAGSTLVVGSYWDAVEEDNFAGAVYAYVKADPTLLTLFYWWWKPRRWRRQAKIVLENPTTFDTLGASVAVGGSTLVAGVPFFDEAGGTNQGGVLVQVRQGSNDDHQQLWWWQRLRHDTSSWRTVQTLQASNAQRDDLFGSAVAVHGNTIVVGALASRLIFNDTNDDEEFRDAGAVYVYDTNDHNNNWTERAVLNASDAVAGAAFGASVSVHETVLVVGAPGRGQAYVFERSHDPLNANDDNDPLKANNDDWSQVAILQGIDNFGVSVATDGTTVVVGATSENDNAGAVYVYARSEDDNDSGNHWTRVTRLTTAQPRAQFGASVDVQGPWIVVGAPLVTNAGAAYVFEKATDDSWTATTTLTACDASPGDAYGTSVAVDGDQIVVGAPASDLWPRRTDAGAVYVYQWGRRRRLRRRLQCRRRNSDG